LIISNLKDVGITTLSPGKEMYIADTLSRAYLKDLPNDNESNIEGVNMLSDHAVIVSVLHEALSSKLILAVCDLTSLELFFHMYIGETFRVQI
jgi:hypothetical protein